MEIRLIYASQANQPLTLAEVVGLLETSRANNARTGISGLLMYCGESFLQVLEGPPEGVDATYQRIQADPRHCELRLLARVVISRRKYREWSMGFKVLDEHEFERALPGYKPETSYPLVSSALIQDAEVAELVLDRYQRNFTRPLIPVKP